MIRGRESRLGAIRATCSTAVSAGSRRIERSGPYVGPIGVAAYVFSVAVLGIMQWDG